jgi:hypothetical protein
VYYQDPQPPWRIALLVTVLLMGTGTSFALGQALGHRAPTATSRIAGSQATNRARGGLNSGADLSAGLAHPVAQRSTSRSKSVEHDGDAKGREAGKHHAAADGRGGGEQGNSPKSSGNDQQVVTGYAER